MRVAEVGREKQENLRCASVCVVGSDLRAHVEALYLAGAGVGCIRVRESICEDVATLNSDVVVEVDSEKSQHASAHEVDARVSDLDSAAAAIASGSLAALATLKELFARIGDPE
jgi:molybdopterin/thiamine biosynthesis adenylyltransferase